MSSMSKSTKNGFGHDLWYTVQPKEKSTVSWDLLTNGSDTKTKKMRSIPGEKRKPNLALPSLFT